MQSQTSFAISPRKNTTHKSRGNRNRSPQKGKQENQEVNASFLEDLDNNDENKGTKKIDSNTSFLHQQDDQQDEIDRKFKEDAISEKQSDDEELKPDKPSQEIQNLNDSKWDFDEDKKKQQEPQKVIVKRGTPGNRPSSESQKQTENKKSQIQTSKTVDPDHQLPSESSGPKRRGNRFPQNQRKNEDDSYPRGNKEYYNGNRGNYNQYNRDGRESNYRGSYRGGRGGRGGYNSSYRNYESNTQSTYNSDKKFQTDKEMNQSTYKNPDFGKKRGPYDQRNRYNNNYRSGGGYNNRDYEPKRSQPQIIEKIVQKVVQKQVIVEKLIQPPRPIGIRARPSVSIYVKGCKLQLTCRRLQQFKADLLVIPYKTPKLQLYPGSFVNSLKINYKQKLKQKAPKLEEQKKLVYLQKCVGSQSITALAFLKVVDPQNNIKDGIKQLFQQIKKIQESKKRNQKQTQKFQTIIFPICSQLQAFKTLISSLIKQIQKYCPIVKEVFISTQDPKAFCEAMAKFNEIFVELFDENQISFN